MPSVRLIHIGSRRVLGTRMISIITIHTHILCTCMIILEQLKLNLSFDVFEQFKLNF